VLVQNGEFPAFWKTHLDARARKAAIVCGLGFDTRACLIAEKILEAQGDGPRDLWLVCYDNGQSDAAALQPMVERNNARFEAAFKDRGTIRRLALNLRGEQGRVASGPVTQALMQRQKELAGYDDVIVDVSAMPRMMGMTTIGFLVADFDARQKRGEAVPNLFVAVAESIALDRGMANKSFQEQVVSVPGFTGRIDAQSVDNPKIWLPVLGEGQQLRLQRIYDKVQPDEICPVVPFPSRDPRRGDALIEEYREVLFDGYRVDPRNIVYASEFNPFEAYRQIFATVNRYREALKELGSCRAVISPLSSKLLSVGALLAAYDLSKPAGGGRRSPQFHVGMHYVEAGSYHPASGGSDPACELSGLWVLGEWEH
jgi:hypothetical protein